MYKTEKDLTEQEMDYLYNLTDKQIERFDALSLILEQWIGTQTLDRADFIVIEEGVKKHYPLVLFDSDDPAEIETNDIEEWFYRVLNREGFCEDYENALEFCVRGGEMTEFIWSDDIVEEING